MKNEWQDRLYQANDDELTRGYLREGCACLYCNQRLTDPLAAQQHVKAIHGGPLGALLYLDKSFTGLTDKQRALISLWHDGVPDQELAAQTQVSISTLRNQRFALRQREREARLFLATLKLSGLSGLRQKKKAAGEALDVSRYFSDGQLKSMPTKDKPRAAVMLYMLNQFAPNRRYSDQEVRALLKPIYEDYAMVRRYLVDNGLLHRTTDGKVYWRNASDKEEPVTIDKKAAKLAYKQTVVDMGVYRITNTQNGRILLGTSTNVNSVKNNFSFTMRWGNSPIGPFSDTQLRADYAEQPDAFIVEVLETVDQSKCENKDQALLKLEGLDEKYTALYEDQEQYIRK